MICSGGTIAKLAMPQIRIATAAGSGQCMTFANTTSTAATIAKPPIGVRSLDRPVGKPPASVLLIVSLNALFVGGSTMPARVRVFVDCLAARFGDPGA